MEHERTESSRELAHAYVQTLIPSLQGAMELQLGPVAKLLDWSAILEPCVAVMMSELTDEELQRAIAWNESPLYAKLVTMQPLVASAVAAGLKAALR